MEYIEKEMIIEVEMIKRRVIKEMERMVIEVERTETDIHINQFGYNRFPLSNKRPTKI